jgi:hypothetical protein
MEAASEHIGNAVSPPQAHRDCYTVGFKQCMRMIRFADDGLAFITFPQEYRLARSLWNIFLLVAARTGRAEGSGRF